MIQLLKRIMQFQNQGAICLKKTQSLSDLHSVNLLLQSI
jgi:hypothetical protein